VDDCSTRRCMFEMCRGHYSTDPIVYDPKSCKFYCSVCGTDEPGEKPQYRSTRVFPVVFLLTAPKDIFVTVKIAARYTPIWISVSPALHLLLTVRLTQRLPDCHEDSLNSKNFDAVRDHLIWLKMDCGVWLLLLFPRSSSCGQWLWTQIVTGVLYHPLEASSRVPLPEDFTHAAQSEHAITFRL
jgi:hypothetical protein